MENEKKAQFVALPVQTPTTMRVSQALVQMKKMIQVITISQN